VKAAVRRRRVRPLSLIAALAVAAVAAVAVVVPTLRPTATEATRPELQGILDALVTGRDRIAPGVSAYVSGPHGTWVGSAGLSNVRTGEPMRPDARMRLESLSKTWTATLVLQLVDEGRMRLDDTVARWLPELLPYGGRITIRQLLDHTSGIVDTSDLLGSPTRYLDLVEDPELRARIATVSRRVTEDPGYEFSPRLWVEIAAALPLEHRPGTTYHYSNIGYTVAGLVAERVSGADLAALLQERIIEPLHLTSAAYDPHSQISGRHARGYRVAADGKLTDATNWTLGLGPGGGVVSNATDEARFLRALMRGRLLGPARLAELEEPSAANPNYGLGTGVDATGCAGIAYGHNGGGDGFETNVYVAGDGSRVAVLLLNGRTADGHGDDVALRAMNRLYCAA
jgi:D-alanyl-D-alanine carboxypeptidase